MTVPAMNLKGAVRLPAADRAMSPRLYVAVAILLFLLAQGNVGAVLRGELPDNDDAMRLVGIRDLLAGQGWFDTTQYRFVPPAGASMHWSRWVDLPIVPFVLLGRALVGAPAGDLLATIVWPPVVFALFAAVLFRETRRAFGERVAAFALLAATQLSTVGLWSVGRIDHHNVQALLLTAAAFGVAMPNPLGRAGWRAVARPVGAGLGAGLSLAVGLETLPFVAALGIVSALGWMTDPRRDGPAFAGFGAGLAIGAALFFAGQTAPSRWGIAECDALSPPWLLLAVAGGLGAAGLVALGDRLPGPAGRLAAAACLGGVVVGAFVPLYPACLSGPYAALPPIAREKWLDQVGEALSAWRLFRAAPHLALAGLAPIVVALGAALAWQRHETGDRRRVLRMAAAFLAIGAAITLHQVRGTYIGSALVPIVAGLALARAVTALETRGPRLRAVLAAGLALAMLGTVWSASGRLVLVALALRDDGPAPPPARCGRFGPLPSLRAVPPGLVLASGEVGSSILLSTPHAILAAPYHRNVEGIVAGIGAESGTEDQVIGAVARFRPDYLLTCVAKPDPARRATLAERLEAGERVSWLEPLPPAGGVSDWRLFRITALPAPPLRPTAP